MVIEQRQKYTNLERINAISGYICGYICSSELLTYNITYLCDYFHIVSLLPCFLLPVSQTPTIKGKLFTGFSSPKIPGT